MPLTTSTKIVIAVVVTVIVVTVLAIGAYFLFWRNTSTPITETSVTPSSATVSTTSGPATLPTNSTSNTALTQDLSAIDSQLSGLNSDNSNVAQSLNDQQVPQSNL